MPVTWTVDTIPILPNRDGVGSAGITELPPFSLNGELFWQYSDEIFFNGPVEFGSYVMRDEYVAYWNIVEYAITTRTGLIGDGGPWFRLYVNETMYEEFYTDVNGLKIVETNIPLAPYDRVWISLFSIQSLPEDVMIVCRLGVPTLPPVEPPDM